MTYVAVLGFGTVGSGVVEIINNNSFINKAGGELTVKAILDIRDFTDSPYAQLFTKDFDAILNDKEISIVVETIGGINPAYEYTLKALKSGKSVVTSNKELVATYGAELMRVARENNAVYLFEASVGGGIPIIRPLNNCLAANDIEEIMGILNGTTNYILTQMIKNGVSFEKALSDAQEKGYAERNPEADIEGHDTCRKIAILSALSYGKQIDSNLIPTEGITKITLEDVAYAQSMDCAIKLIGYSKKVNGGVYARVSPMMLSKDHPLAGVEDVFNAILVKGSATGDVMFYGKGAGKMPTASAVVADCIDIVKHKSLGAPFWEDGGELVFDIDFEDNFYLRVAAGDKQRCESAAQAVFGKVRWLDSNEKEVAFVTGKMTDKAFKEGVEKFETLVGSENILGKIRVLI
ncbi:MAG: homoserine dehydrogenase [Eubacteriales bacterium]|jgi:homoserine dehydrogenase|nr:homoserine dehydrogenase [Eubacteriales bacterium]